MIFTNVVKPTHLCNLSCSYCYNDDVRKPVMDELVLERVISQTFAYIRNHTPGRLASFIWHGGEPMIAGLSFYKRVIQLQEQYAGDVKFNNSLQTNGTLIDAEWLSFLRETGFSLSISIDGPRHIHDIYRKDRKGRGSFDTVSLAIEMAQNAGIPIGACVVISRSNIDHVEEIYDFLAEHKLRFNVIPLNRSGAAREHYGSIGLDAEEYGHAWIRMYDKWFDSTDKYVYCSDFVFKTRAILAGKPADCIGLSQCSSTNISIDPVGDVYPCATLSGTTDALYGNIMSANLEVLMSTPRALDFRNRRTDSQCQSCRWQHVCHGGCLTRAYKFFGTHHHRDYYCPSLFSIYEHIARRLSDALGTIRLEPALAPTSENHEVELQQLITIRRI